MVHQFDQVPAFQDEEITLVVSTDLSESMCVCVYAKSNELCNMCLGLRVCLGKAYSTNIKLLCFSTCSKQF